MRPEALYQLGRAHSALLLAQEALERAAAAGAFDDEPPGLGKLMPDLVATVASYVLGVRDAG